MKTQDWDAAFYKKGDMVYPLWAYSTEVSYVFEYNPNLIDYPWIVIEWLKVKKRRVKKSNDCLTFRSEIQQKPFAEDVNCAFHCLLLNLVESCCIIEKTTVNNS